MNSEMFRRRSAVKSLSPPHEPPKGRQVLDCGDGVRGVTALALPASEALELAAGTGRPPQSGDFADSVAAVQDAHARTEVHGSKARSWTSGKSHPGPLPWGEGEPQAAAALLSGASAGEKPADDSPSPHQRELPEPRPRRVPLNRGASGTAAVAQISNLSVSPGIVAGRDDFREPSAGLVAQVSNLLYRRLPVGRPLEGRGAGGLEIRDTAGWKPALLWLRLSRPVLYRRLPVFSCVIVTC